MAKQFRAIVVTKEGRRYVTRWRADLMIAIRAGERLAAKKNLNVKTIDGQVREKGNQNG